MHKGRVKYFNAKSKFGFIIDLESGEEYYVHEKYLLDKIAADDQVSFELKMLKRGNVAINVRKEIGKT